jgi:hypothetical protein
LGYNKRNPKKGIEIVSALCALVWLFLPAFSVTTKEIPKRELRFVFLLIGLVLGLRRWVTTKEIPKRELRF